MRPESRARQRAAIRRALDADRPDGGRRPAANAPKVVRFAPRKELQAPADDGRSFLIGGRSVLSGRRARPPTLCPSCGSASLINTDGCALCCRPPSLCGGKISVKNSASDVRHPPPLCGGMLLIRGPVDVQPGDGSEIASADFRLRRIFFQWIVHHHAGRELGPGFLRFCRSFFSLRHLYSPISSADGRRIGRRPCILRTGHTDIIGSRRRVYPVFRFPKRRGRRIGNH